MAGLFNAMNGSGFFRVLYDESHDLVGNLNGTGAQDCLIEFNQRPDRYFARKRSMLAAAVV